MARNTGKLNDGFAKGGPVSKLGGKMVPREMKSGKLVVLKSASSARSSQVHARTENGKAGLAAQKLAVLEPVEAWCGNPRDMRDEDLEFFGLER
ncbi:hypothetical protein [Neogemmobacter tilapiae]|uniref:Uncharacterized protein n=1 Tax=Neogemmobacter tilapiae TaxID=875041 RepID=A0A918WPU0_9RHOB|nr:hypothetical protein [Gemmobacter tilapiae]GHC62914.1 hypothetical protein GCM10007315_28910 [Gemmobacter tilapiae]